MNRITHLNRLKNELEFSQCVPDLGTTNPNFRVQHTKLSRMVSLHEDLSTVQTLDFALYESRIMPYNQLPS